MKNKVICLTTSVVFLLSFNIIFFLFKTGSLTESVWCSYAFIHVGCIAFLLACFLENSYKETALKLSSSAIGLGYFLCAFCVGMVVIFLAPESAKIPIAIQVILLAAFLILIITNMVNNDKIQQKVIEREENIQYVDSVCRILNSIMEDCQDANILHKLEKLYDVVHASPIMRNEAAWSVEDNIINSVFTLEKQVKSISVEQANEEIEQLIVAANKRNLIVKSI